MARPALFAAIPLKSWQIGMQRLAGTLDPRARERLAAGTARRVAVALAEAGFRVVIIAGDRDVAAWAEGAGIDAIPDGGAGLDGAAEAAVTAAGDAPWCIAHGDLPLMTAADASAIAAGLSAGATVLCPARDGGTNVIAARGPFRFRFGPGSFSRHLAAARAPARVVVRLGTAVEVDTPRDLEAAAALPGGEWLRALIG